MVASPVLIFDLNRTLVFSTHHPDPGMPEPDVRLGAGKAIWARPGVRAFLKWAFGRFDVAIWSSHMRHNAASIVRWLLTPEQQRQLCFFWTRESCTLTGDGYGSAKPLAEVARQLGIERGRLWLIDDEKTKCAVEDLPQYIYVAPYVPTPTQDTAGWDIGLMHLRRRLEELFPPDLKY